jgi:hypothetical protein
MKTLKQFLDEKGRCWQVTRYPGKSSILQEVVLKNQALQQSRPATAIAKKKSGDYDKEGFRNRNIKLS